MLKGGQRDRPLPSGATQTAIGAVVLRPAEEGEGERDEGGEAEEEAVASVLCGADAGGQMSWGARERGQRVWSAERARAMALGAE